LPLGDDFLKVLIVHPGLSFYGGAELLVIKLANYLSSRGVDTSILTLSISDEVRKELKKTRVIALRDRAAKKKGLLKLLDFLYGTMQLWGYVQMNKGKYDVINPHNFPAEYALFPSTRNSVWMCNEPPIQFYLTPKLGFPASFMQGILKGLDRLVVRSSVGYSCVSDDFNYERFVKIYGIRPTIINYGIDYEFLSKGEGKKAVKMFNLGNRFVLLQVGTLTPLRNQMESIKAVERLKGRIPNIKLVLAGLGEEDYEKALKGYVKDKGLGRQVLFTGHIPRDIVRNLYKACDVALFPIKSQGGWLSPFEALCAGKPIIVSHALTSSNIIKKNKLGVVTEDFAGAVAEFYGNQEKYRKMADKGRVWVKNNLTWDGFCGELLEMFKKAAA
jgi:glycosyltransferase involved in cell wall biosynthesis